jgi:hypothetical protein
MVKVTAFPLRSESKSPSFTPTYYSTLYRGSTQRQEKEIKDIKLGRKK